MLHLDLNSEGMSEHVKVNLSEMLQWTIYISLDNRNTTVQF